MKTITLELPGEPKGKQRPRVTMRGGFATAYTPKETVNYETYVKTCYIQQNRHEMLEGPIRAEVKAYFSIPKSTSQKRRKLMVDGEIKNTKKPDCDNVAKIILDSLNGIAYHDDSQICELTVEKLYGEQPRVVLTLSKLEENQGENKA